MNGQVDSKAFVQILVWLEEAAAQSSHTPCLNLRPSCCSYVTAWLSALWLSALLKDHHISLPAFEMTGLIAIIPHFSIASHWYNVCLIIAKWLDKSYRTIPCLTIRLQRCDCQSIPSGVWLWGVPISICEVLYSCPECFPITLMDDIVLKSTTSTVM